MSELFGQLGINWPMLSAQAVNFGVLLLVLTIFVYRPLLRILDERRQKIETGLRGAELAEQKLAAAEQLGAEKIRTADKEAVAIIGQAEQTARQRGQEIVAKMTVKSDKILAEAEATAQRQKAEALVDLTKEAKGLLTEALAQAVWAKPEEVDEKLIARAMTALKEKV